MVTFKDNLSDIVQLLISVDHKQEPIICAPYLVSVITSAGVNFVFIFDMYLFSNFGHLILIIPLPKLETY